MSQVQHGANRRHASLACNACRESKIKCNGQVPSCSSCSKKDRECVYRAVDRRKLPLRVAIDLLSSRVVQLCRHMSENGLQPLPMPPGKGAALKKILASLGLHDAVRDILAEGADGLEASPQAAGPATQSTHRDDAGLWQSPIDSTAALARVGTHESTRKDESSYDMGFGTDLQLWDSHGEMESSYNNSGFKVPTPYTSDASPLGEVFGINADTVSSGQSQVNYEGPSIFNETDTSEGGGSNESLVDELSHRVGTLTIGHAGRTKLRGPSLMFDVEKAKDSEIPRGNWGPLKNAASPSAHSGSGPDVPEELQEHLTNQYFDWENPYSDLVDREIYTLAKAQYRKGEETPYFSQALCNAMCAVGAAFESRYHPTFVTYPKSLVSFFVDRARMFLEMELDDPSLATNQAITVLSCHEAGNGNKSRAWLYSGMAVRLAFDLALHLDMSSNLSSGEVTLAEVNLRCRLFWGIHAVDHVLGFELGRPVRQSMEDVTVNTPTTPGAKHSLDNSPAGSDQNRSSPAVQHSDLEQHVRKQRVALFNIMAACGYLLYGTSKYSKDILQELNAGIVAQLCDWKAKLPRELQIDLDKPYIQATPSALLLHMHYHQSIIYAHRPWMSKHILQPQPPRGPGHRHAREMCVQSAIAISKIIVLYESQHDLRHIHHSAVHVTSSAAYLLLFADLYPLPEWKGQGIRACLSTCFRALGEYAVSWNSATQVTNTLLETQRKWRNRSVSASTSQHSKSATSTSLNDVPSTNNGSLDAFSAENVTWTQDGDGTQDSNLFDPDFDWGLMPDFQYP